MIFDYETLKLIWWAFVGLVLIAFALTDGWDFGIGMLSPFLGKSDDERRVILRSIEPNWEGNQTWFIIAGGVVFAAWPMRPTCTRPSSVLNNSLPGLATNTNSMTKRICAIMLASPPREPEYTIAIHIGMVNTKPNTRRVGLIGRRSIRPSNKPSDISTRKAK